jgi:DNA-binding transcriptional LysR family regulator
MDVHYTLRQLQYFAAVARTGTMSEAAVRCHVSQPALSLAISQLERSLGLQLFLRQRSRGAELTPAGARVLAQAESLLAQAALLQESADGESGDLDGNLAVGCYTTLAPLFVPALLTGFRAECPQVALEFAEYAQPELQRDLHKGVLELALLYDRQLDPDLDYVEIERLRPYVLLPAGHRFADDDAVRLAALASEPMILFDVSPSRENWQEIVRSLAIEPVVGHRTRNFELTRCLVGRGLGYALLFQRRWWPSGSWSRSRPCPSSSRTRGGPTSPPAPVGSPSSRSRRCARGATPTPTPTPTPTGLFEKLIRYPRNSNLTRPDAHPYAPNVSALYTGNEVSLWRLSRTNRRKQ